jgi:hypothetical protein
MVTNILLEEVLIMVQVHKTPQHHHTFKPYPLMGAKDI